MKLNAILDTAVDALAVVALGYMAINDAASIEVIGGMIVSVALGKRYMKRGQ